MPELGIRNQCFFIAVYASIILLCAATMTSQQTGSLGGTVTTRYICSTCEKKGLRSFFLCRIAPSASTWPGAKAAVAPM